VFGFESARNVARPAKIHLIPRIRGPRKLSSVSSVAENRETQKVFRPRAPGKEFGKGPVRNIGKGRRPKGRRSLGKVLTYLPEPPAIFVTLHPRQRPPPNSAQRRRRCLQGTVGVGTEKKGAAKIGKRKRQVHRKWQKDLRKAAKKQEELRL